MNQWTNTKVGNWSGLASLALSLLFWLANWFAPPFTNVYLRYVALPLAMILALLLAVVALTKASNWWSLALILPSTAILGLLTTLN